VKTDTPREQAIAFIATYDTPDGGAYERHVVRVARTWLRIMNTTMPVQGIVDRIMEEFDAPETDDYGCGWDAIRKNFTQWAVAEEWLKEGLGSTG